jgi:hypothetical protein
MVFSLFSTNCSVRQQPQVGYILFDVCDRRRRDPRLRRAPTASVVAVDEVRKSIPELKLAPASASLVLALLEPVDTTAQTVVPAVHRAHLGHQAVRRGIDAVEPRQDHRHVVLEAGDIVEYPLDLTGEELKIDFGHFALLVGPAPMRAGS